MSYAGHPYPFSGLIPLSPKVIMANPYSGFPWFDDDSWIGRELAFEEPAPPRWKVAQRISESESLFNEWEFETAALGPKRALSFYATVSTIKPKEP
jgi:hypothetical protein